MSPEADDPTPAGAERVTIRETGDGLGIHLPAVKHVPVILFLLVWLCGWSIGEWFALSEILRGGLGGPDVFLVFWVTLWSAAGAAALSIVLWQLFGVERLFVTGGALVKETGIGPLRRRRVWALENVGAVVPAGERKGGRRGGIAFEADGKLRHFGRGMNPAETEAVLAALRRHVPSMKRPAASTTEQPA